MLLSVSTHYHPPPIFATTTLASMAHEPLKKITASLGTASLPCFLWKTDWESKGRIIYMYIFISFLLPSLSSGHWVVMALISQSYINIDFHSAMPSLPLLWNGIRIFFFLWSFQQGIQLECSAVSSAFTRQPCSWVFYVYLMLVHLKRETW